MKTRALEQVGQLTLPPGIHRHPNMREAWAVATVVGGGDLERVIGTSNSKVEAGRRVELYGWGADVPMHIDDLGFVYFSPLRMAGGSVVVAGDHDSLNLKPGGVYRLDDRQVHGTYDDGPVVCAFLGPFPEPGDVGAVGRLQAGVDALATKWWDAPRVARGFRVPRRGEVWATSLEPNDGTRAELVPVKVARARGDIIAYCTCGAHAVKLDRFFPYMAEDNRCERCVMREDREAA